MSLDECRCYLQSYFWYINYNGIGILIRKLLILLRYIPIRYVLPVFGSNQGNIWITICLPNFNQIRLKAFCITK